MSGSRRTVHRDNASVNDERTFDPSGPCNRIRRCAHLCQNLRGSREDRKQGCHLRKSLEDQPEQVPPMLANSLLSIRPVHTCLAIVRGTGETPPMCCYRRRTESD